MEADLLSFIQANPSFAYLSVFGVLLLCGLGLPMPEDIVLVTGGYMVYVADTQNLGSPTLATMLVVGMVGVLSGDTILFFAGKRLGPRVTRVWPFRLMINAKRMERVQRFFNKYGARTAFVARFAAGLRAPTYLLAGTAGMRFRTFLFADGLAALLSVPAWIVLAWYFGAEINQVKEWMGQSKWLIAGLLGILVIYILYRVIKSRRQKKQAADSAFTSHEGADSAFTSHAGDSAFTSHAGATSETDEDTEQ